MIVGGEQREPALGLVIRFSKPVEELLGFLLVKFEEGPGYSRIGIFEVVGGKFLLLEQPDLAVGCVCGPSHVVDAVNSLEVGADAVQAVRQFDGDRV